MNALIEERFRAFFEPGAAGECWPWRGVVGWDGYGCAGTRHRRAHRVAYEVLIGPVPPGLQIDHACHNRAPSCVGGYACPHRSCVNPDHLEAVTQGENVRRAVLNRIRQRVALQQLRKPA